MSFRFEDFELDTETFQLCRAGCPVPVEPQVFDVLAYLVRNHNRVVTKEELLDEVWGGRFVSESALTTTIKLARRALEDSGRTQRLIRNTHGRGYRFMGDVEHIAGPATHPAAATSEDGRPSTTPVAPAARRRNDSLSLLVDEEFPFVGRAALLASAAQQTARVVAGNLESLLIGGEPGMGKTRLATEVARRASPEGLRPLAGRCDPHLATSLQPWLEALGAYVQVAADDTLRADTSGVIEHLRPIFPTLDARLPAQPDTMAPRFDEYATIDALAVFIERVSRREPLLVVLDDVQWAGGATRSLVSLLLRRGQGRLLIVLTFRTTIDDLDETVRDWLTELSTRHGSSRVDLQPLGSADVADLVEGADVASDLANQVWELSGGHSLFAVELLRDVRRGIGLPHLPETVAALVRSRLDRLPNDVTKLVNAGAAIGQEFRLDIAAEAAELTTESSLEVIEIAMAAELVHEIPGSVDQFRFSHQLVPAAVLDNMTTSRRVRLHARLAAVLEATGGSRAAVAHHLIEAAPVLERAEVIDRVRSTAEAELLEHQYDTAAGLLARCAELPMDDRHRAEVLAELGHAYNAAGRQPQALAPFERTAEIARAHGWPDLLAAAALGLWGQSPFRASQDRSVVPLLEEALHYEDELDACVVARLLAKRAAFSLFTAPLSKRDAMSGRAERLVGSQSSRDRLEVLEARWMAIACPRTVHEIRSLDEELALLRKELGALTTDACAPEIGLYWRGEGEALWQLANELEDDPRQRRDVDQWRTTTLTATKALFRGDYDEARRLTDVALPLGREPWGESGRVVHALVHLLLDALTGTLERSLSTWREVVAAVPSNSMRATCAWVESVVGDAAAADATVTAIADDLGAMAVNFMGGFGLVGFGETVLALDRRDLFDPLREVLYSLSDRMLGHPWAPSLAAADVLGRLELRRGAVDVAAPHVATAQRLYEQLGASTLAKRLDFLCSAERSSD